MSKLFEVRREYTPPEMPTKHAIGYLRSALVYLDETRGYLQALRTKVDALLKDLERGKRTDETHEGVIGAFALIRVMNFAAARAIGEVDSARTGRQNPQRRQNIRLVDLAQNVTRYNLREAADALQVSTSGLRAGLGVLLERLRG